MKQKTHLSVSAIITIHHDFQYVDPFFEIFKIFLERINRKDYQ